MRQSYSWFTVNEEETHISALTLYIHKLHLRHI